jgi:hypothetical protein
MRSTWAAFRRAYRILMREWAQREMCASHPDMPEVVLELAQLRDMRRRP